MPPFQGLTMVLRHNGSENLFSSEADGWLLTVHRQSVHPFPSVHGRKIGPGSAAQFAMRLVWF